MINKIALIFLAVFLISWTPPGTNKLVKKNIPFITKQTNGLLSKIGEPKGQYPRTINKNGSIRTTDIYGWTSGFFPGTLWYLYELTNDNYWKTTAEKWTSPLEPNQFNKDDHDVGFMMYCSYGNGLRLTGNKEYKDILIQTANSLITRYNPIVGSIQSWQPQPSHHNKSVFWDFPVIIDNMMNLELLFWTSKETGDKKYYDIAVKHANTVIKNHLRDDYSCYHVVAYNPKTGKVVDKATAQGFSDNSTWARGQAWGVYGFTLMYRETKDKKYLDVAEKMAAYFLNNPTLPKDKIPYWDFNVNQKGFEPKWKYDASSFKEIPRDASAAAIIASALLELSEHTKNKKYFKAAEKMLKTLSSGKYTAKYNENGNFLLKHSTGSLPHGKEIDVPLVYADYYYVEALQRYAKIKN